MAGEGQAPLSFGRMEVYAGTPILDRLQREGRLTGSYLAWNYVIPDPRVEMLFRLMIAALRHRHYSNDGLGKQSSIAYYELVMFQYQRKAQADPEVGAQLRNLVARVNNSSLGILEEMFDFVLHENIYDASLVNDQAASWASRVNLFDLQVLAELEAWRAQVAQSVSC